MTAGSPGRGAVRALALAQEQYEAAEFESAQAACQRVLSDDAADAEAHLLLGKTLRAQGDNDGALRHLELAVSLDGTNPKAFKHLARSLAEMGQLSEATQANRKALALAPREVGVLCQLAQLTRLSADDPVLHQMEELERDRDRLPAADLIQLLFALAKVYDDLGEYDEAFARLQRANKLQRNLLNYDVTRDLDFFDRIKETFDGPLLARLRGSGCQSKLPILIVGMPRSGTTLVEQILASHPAVHGAGELGHLHQLATGIWLLNDTGVQFPAGVADLSSQSLERLGRAYVERLPKASADTQRTIDKNPLNFAYVGLVALILPHARVIHCVRDPLDICMSCYSLRFRSVDFAYDLEELGRYYAGFSALMEHWRRVLPESVMLDVSYEQLVGDIETQARSVIAHCGLDWDDACLSFHSAKRSVQTLSLAQVRRPVYGGSVGRWRRYERHLGPLMAALDGAAGAP